VDLGTNRATGGKKHQTYRHQLPEFKLALAKTQDLIRTTDAWGTVFLENHDQGRSISRFATHVPQYREAAAKMLALCITALTGTLFIYQGQEIGMYNHSEEWTITDLRDIDSINAYRDVEQRYNNDPVWNAKAMRGLAAVGRDNARLPVQWSAEPNAGFTGKNAKPWIRVHDDYENVNVAEQLGRDDSPLAFWKRMLKVRRKYQRLMVLGDFEMHDLYEQDTFTFVKRVKGAVTDGNGDGAAMQNGHTEHTEESKAKIEPEILVTCNFSDRINPVDFPARMAGRKRELLVSSLDEEGAGKYLRAWEGRIYLVT